MALSTSAIEFGSLTALHAPLLRGKCVRPGAMPTSMIPLPWSWAPSRYWDGNDGSWNTFLINVGDPPQLFRILPSTAGQETWVLVPEGCTTSDPSDCPSRRGAFNEGFVTGDSVTWEARGIYTLDDQEAKLGYTGNGLYGQDTVTLGNDSSTLQLEDQVVAGIATKAYYLGEFGLGPKVINFTNFNNGIPSFMSNLVNMSYIPSLSFAYTAGAAYRNKSASLTLGGYDSNRFTSRTSFTMNEDNSRPLQVGLTKILGQNTLSGTSNLLPTATYHFIDSTIPHIWLPSDAAQAFVAAFGLTYDNATDLFLINASMRSRHLQNKPTVTFILSSNTQDNTAPTQAIVLPYGAFDLQASSPYYENATNYFPIRIAHNDTQYTIGRTFLQEAYVIADWQRQNFSVAQTVFDGSPSIVPILTDAESNATSSTGGQQTSTAQSAGQQGLSGGAIAGVVVGVIAGIAILAAIIGSIFWRRRKQRHVAAAQAYYPDEKKEPLEETTGGNIDEVPADNLQELPSPPARYPEIDGNPAKWSGHGVQELAAQPVGHELDSTGRPVTHELPDNEVQR